MTIPLDRAGLARLPIASLAALAPLRDAAGVSVRSDGDRAWVAWEPGDPRVIARLIAVPGLVWYVERDGLWYPHGSPLPAFDVPATAEPGVPIARALGPAPVEPDPAPGGVITPVQLALARDDRPRPTTALLCPVAELARWADSAPTVTIERVRAARSGGMALLLGEVLPPVPGGERYWGEGVLVPLGWSIRPDWPEPMLLRALGAGAGDLARVAADATVEVIPRHAFRPLTRAGLRLAIAAEGRGGPA